MWSLTCTALVCLVTFATSFIPGKALFIVLTDLSGVAGFVTWGGICLAHFRFRKALKRQGRGVEELPITTPLHPFGDIFGMIACTVIALMAGYASFIPPVDPVGIIGNYGGLVCVALLFLILRFWTKSRFIPIDEIDIDTGRADYSQFKDEDNNSYTGLPFYKKAWKKFVYIVT